MSLFDQLRDQKNFSSSEKSIANFILERPDDIKTMGITELARRTYSSNAAIIRLCRKVGLDGYKEFRIAFAADLEKQRHNAIDVEVNQPFIARETPESIMRSVANISHEAIESCYNTISASHLDRAARTIRNARHIYLYAAGESCLNALVFANMMLKLGYPTIQPAQFNESPDLTNNATDKDVALVVSYSGFVMNSMKHELQILKQHHVPVISITSQKENPEVDIHISIPNKEQRIGKAAGYYSQTAIRFVLNCIYSIVYSLDLQKNRERKDQIDAHSYGQTGTN